MSVMNLDYRQLANIILFIALEMLILDSYQVNSLKLAKISLLSDDKPLLSHQNKTNEITTKAPVANKPNVVDKTRNKTLAVNLAGLELLSIKNSESKGVKENADSPGIKKNKVANDATGGIGDVKTEKNKTVAVNLAGLELLSIKKSNSGGEGGVALNDNKPTTTLNAENDSTISDETSTTSERHFSTEVQPTETVTSTNVEVLTTSDNLLISTEVEPLETVTFDEITSTSEKINFSTEGQPTETVTLTNDEVHTSSEIQHFSTEADPLGSTELSTFEEITITSEESVLSTESQPTVIVTSTVKESLCTPSDTHDVTSSTATPSTSTSASSTTPDPSTTTSSLPTSTAPPSTSISASSTTPEPSTTTSPLPTTTAPPSSSTSAPSTTPEPSTTTSPPSTTTIPPSSTSPEPWTTTPSPSTTPCPPLTTTCPPPTTTTCPPPTTKRACNKSCPQNNPDKNIYTNYLQSIIDILKIVQNAV